MYTIHKYPLNIIGEQRLMLPMYAQYLTIQLQYGLPVMWCVIRTEDPLRELVITMYTEEPIERNYTGTYLATIQLNGLLMRAYCE